MSQKINYQSKIKDIMALPIGHDVMNRLFIQTGLPFSLLKNPMILNLKLKTVMRLTKKQLPFSFYRSVINLVNSELEEPLEDQPPIQTAWWKEAVFYQIYPRSFKDSNDDGIGDIQGIISKLDTLQDLGITALWLSPIYDSPNDDNGYDIRDYHSILAEFGTLADVEQLIAELKKRGMRIIMDLVVNHTSDEHPWFQAALAGDGEKQAYYFFRKQPNNWTSFFSGPAWKYFEEVDLYALKLFSDKQFDLNWENPKVRQEIQDIVTFWLDKGIDGFRMDVINYISKAPGLPDGQENIGELIGFTGMEHYFYGPRLNEYLHELRKKAFKPHHAFSVGETPGIGIQLSKLLSGDYRQVMDLTFSFDHLETPGHVRFEDYDYDLEFYKYYMIESQKAFGNHYWMSLFVDNHDNPRFISKIDKYHVHRDELAKAVNLILLTLRGTPFFFQGQEIGMTNNDFQDMNQLRDVESLNKYQELLQSGMSDSEAFQIILSGSRDHSRTPMQWNNQRFGGFSNVEPWLLGDQDLQSTNVEYQQTEPESVYNFTKNLIALRKNTALVYGEVEFLHEKTKGLWVYKRYNQNEEFLIEINLTANYTNRQLDHSDYGLLLSNVPSQQKQLQPYEANLYWRSL